MKRAGSKKFEPAFLFSGIKINKIASFIDRVFDRSKMEQILLL